MLKSKYRIDGKYPYRLRPILTSFATDNVELSKELPGFYIVDVFDPSICSKEELASLFKEQFCNIKTLHSPGQIHPWKTFKDSIKRHLLEFPGPVIVVGSLHITGEDYVQMLEDFIPSMRVVFDGGYARTSKILHSFQEAFPTAVIKTVPQRHLLNTAVQSVGIEVFGLKPKG